MIKLKQNNSQKGFSILAIILVIVAVIVAIGVWALSGSTNTSNSGNSANEIQASAIVNDSGALKLAYDTLVIGGTSPAAVTFLPNTAGGANMLDPTNGISSPLTAPKSIREGSTVPNGIWVYAKNWYILGRQTSVMVLAGVKNSVCEKINLNLHGATLVPAYGPISDSQAFVTGATAANPNSTLLIDFSSAGVAVNSLDWKSGCIQGGNNMPDHNVFFRALN